MGMINKTLILSIILIALNAKVLLGQNVKCIEKIEFSPETVPLKALSFCVTDDELFMIPDYGAGNIKVYEENREKLDLISTIGRKGYGPNEFSKPSFCSYSNDEGKYVVMDLGIRKIFIYDRIGRIEFKRTKEVKCWRGGTDIKLIGNKLFISGYISDQNGNPYDFYYIDLTNDKKVVLLPSYRKYGLNSFKEYEIQYQSKSVIPVIGIRGFFDINRDDVYYVWEGNLKVIKLNIISGEKVITPSGKQPPHYVKPFASEKLIEARQKRDINITQKELAKMSYVRNIFTSSKYVFVIYEGPVNQGNVSNFRLQFYTFDGDFIKEVPIPGQIDNKMWFDRDKNILYSLSSNFFRDGRDYFILKYAIYE